MRLVGSQPLIVRAQGARHSDALPLTIKLFTDVVKTTPSGVKETADCMASCSKWRSGVECL